MPQVFFLNPPLIQEIVLWRSNTGENLAVFEPIARACSLLGSLLVPDDADRAAKISKVLDDWCSSSQFESLLVEAKNSKASLSMDLGRETLAQFSGSASFVVGIPIDEVLAAFSALIRANLRARESRSIVRIDEVFLWQACLKRFGLHELSLLILSAFASKDIVSIFDRLLAIKEDPRTLTKIDAELLSTELSAQFTAGMRHFALTNFEATEPDYEAVEQAYTLAIERDPQSPSVYLAMSLLHIMNGKYDVAKRLVNQAKLMSDSDSLASIMHLINILAGEEEIELWSEEPIPVAIVSYFHLQKQEHQRVIAIAEKHLETFPRDIVMHSLLIEAMLMPIRDQFFNDPPLPGALDQDLSVQLDEIRIRLSALIELTNTMKLPSLNGRASLNLSAVALMQRDFKAAAELTKSVLANNPSSGEAKINFAITMLATGDLPKAMGVLTAIPPDLKTMGLRLAAEAHYHGCTFEAALDLWKRILPDDKDRLWRLRTFCRMLEAYRLLRDAENAQFCVNGMLTHFQHEPETLFALGYELWQMNRTDDAIHALRRAKDLAAPNLSKWVGWELGRVLFDAGKNLAATDEYVSIADKSIDSVQAREFAVALYRAGLIPAAYERAKAIREIHGQAVPGITEIETDFLVREARLEEAKALLKALCFQRPLSVLNRMAVVRICATLGQEEEALAEIREIQALRIPEDLQDEVERFASDLEVVIKLKSKMSGK